MVRISTHWIASCQNPLWQFPTLAPLLLPSLLPLLTPLPLGGSPPKLRIGNWSRQDMEQKVIIPQCDCKEHNCYKSKKTRQWPVWLHT